MVKVLLLAGVAITTVLLSCGTNSTQSSNTGSNLEPTPASKDHDASWEASFFEALEERTKEVNVIGLRQVNLDEKDIEVRLWYDAHPDLINGFVLRRLGNHWSGMIISQIDNRWPSQVKLSVLKRPKSGWDSLWKKLVDSGLLTLPDSNQTECHSEVLDGGAFVVETNVSGTYRTYRYSNPQLAACDEAKQVTSIESTIADEFSLDVGNFGVQRMTDGRVRIGTTGGPGGRDAGNLHSHFEIWNGRFRDVVEGRERFARRLHPFTTTFCP